MRAPSVQTKTASLQRLTEGGLQASALISHVTPLSQVGQALTCNASGIDVCERVMHSSACC